MAITLSDATDLKYTRQDAEEVYLRWSGMLPAGKVWQVYLDRRLVWQGITSRCVVPHPVSTRPIWVEVGSTDSADRMTNLSSTLPAVPGTGSNITLTWYGGADISTDFLGFNVYSGLVSGGAVSYVTPVGKVSAQQDPGNGGFGMGGFGEGGFGVASSLYTWISPPMGPGTWNFGVKAYDAAGNESSPILYSATVVSPPRAVPVGPSGVRLAGSYVSGTRTLTLSWLAASP